MRILSHYSKDAGKVFSSGYLSPLDNAHKPGGLWLSDDSEFGWPDLVFGLARGGSRDWADGEELLRHRYDFSVRDDETDSVLCLTTPDDLRSFMSRYREASPRSCIVDEELGFGFHIEWNRVKSDYKGILITPYQQEMSHRRENIGFHWYRFDCASACIWDISCLRQLPHQG